MSRTNAEATAVNARDFIDIGLEAGQEVMSVYADMTIAAMRKTDGSPVTEADRRAEAVILRALGARWPGVPVVAEEEASAGRIPSASETFFLVDPLDGTREFLARNGEFTVNIAFVERGRPAAGLVYAPALRQIFVGDAGGAWRADVRDGVRARLIPIHARAAPAAVTVVASRANCGAETHRWLERFTIAAFVSRGSSLKFCMLAAGEADLYPRFGRTMEWDTAAGDAVLRAAGGTTRTLDGEPLSYGKRGRPGMADFANPDFVAVADTRLDIRAR
jgi:sulfate adenylyltransferase subunit 2/3'(2'), 5'-bisphosphate nucleotidase